MKITSPRMTGSYPDRFEDCQTAIEDVFVQLVVEATRAGWHHEEVLAAITAIADITTIALDTQGKAQTEMRLANVMKRK
ncbi:hypothetical protein EV217_5339 [Phyllobacterium myrsinacearum]|uniref:hypothetical protein n=1 Tax=Phyllobacterium myrsinacearum TaxID=28101 RepID=UPI00102975D7|nr:hypothetical protein [Phyllobacterium myrsinacearum]RZS70637.1 hypothetical protein EV217_5339 [Phyllobacterium myrsinacearum]